MSQSYCASACFLPTEGTGSSPVVYIPQNVWLPSVDPLSTIIPCQARGVRSELFRAEQLVSKAKKSWQGKYPLEDWFDFPKDVVKRLDGLGQHSQKILGAEIVSRLEVFKKYDQNWDGEGAMPLRSGSIAMLDCFVNKFSDFGATPPSLFLTRAGNLQLSWEDESGEAVEVEFFPDRAEYYIARKQIEGEVELDPEDPAAALERIVRLIS